MKKVYYPLWYRLYGEDRYLIWYEMEDADRDLDGVELDVNGKIPVFDSLEALSAYSQSANISIKVPIEPGELNLHNLDVVMKWLRVKRSKPKRTRSLKCKEFLEAWNLFSDVSRSTGGNFDADYDRTRNIYDKLFWGNNLPAITPEGKFYLPRWRRYEKRIIRQVISYGLEMFRNSIKHQ